MEIIRLDPKMFIPAVMKKEIIKFRVMGRKDIRKHKVKNGKTIVVQSILGQKGVIQKDELTKNYRYLNGNSIELNKLSNKKGYWAVRNQEVDAGVVLVPKGKAIQLPDNRVIKSGNYIVFLNNKIYPLKMNLFHKCFIIPRSPAIQYVLDKHAEAHKRKLLTAKTTKSNQIEKPRKQLSRVEKMKNIMESVSNSGKPRSTGNIRNVERDGYKAEPSRNIKASVERPRIERPKSTGSNQTAKYVAIGRVVENGKTVGFVISNGSKNKRISKQEMMKLCLDGKITNIEVVKQGDGKPPFLRGNGIKIQDLPEIAL